MACEKCKHPMHEQFKRYPGYWRCLRPGPKCGRTILETPVELFDKSTELNYLLTQATTPKWCPLITGEGDTQDPCEDEEE